MELTTPKKQIRKLKFPKTPLNDDEQVIFDRIENR